MPEQTAASTAAVRFLKGMLVGLVVIMPGMSGGTMLLAIGLYEKLMRDFARIRILPWVPFFIGLGTGIMLSGILLTRLLQRYELVILAFLFGCILASVRPVLGEYRTPSVKRIVVLIIGLALGFLLASLSDFGVMDDPVPPNAVFLFIGGAISSAAMVLPGVPGGSILIIMGLFDDIMLAVSRFDWFMLSIYGAGSLLGIFALSNALDKLYSRYKATLSWLFVGLIIGSSVMLIPETVESILGFLLIAATGFTLVWKWDKSTSDRTAEAKGK